MPMKRSTVRSSTIRTIGYDPETRVLEIEFHRRGTYRYFDVPDLVYRGLIRSLSKGSYFNTAISQRFRNEEVR
jgi:hypothetical protein